jgi:hypothetical protein
MAAGNDLPHPDRDKERARKQAERVAAAESAEGEEGKEEEDEKDKPQVTVKVQNARGELIRTFKADIHQGINRVVWALRRDGVPPMPPVEDEELKRTLEQGMLPPGPEVPPGSYTVTLAFDGEEAGAEVSVESDPRTPHTPAQMQARYEAQLALLDSQRMMVDAVKRIVNARRDINTLMTLVEDAAPPPSNADADEEDGPYQAVKERADALKENLDALEKRFRVPPETRGIVYSDDKVADRVGLADSFVGSTYDAPSESARTYVRIAESSLEAAVDDLNAVLAEDVPALREAARQAGLGLLGQKPVERN